SCRRPSARSTSRRPSEAPGDDGALSRSGPSQGPGRGFGMTGGRLDFLLEIGCEEIPARMIGGAALDLAERVVGILDAAALAHGESRTYSTPRRLAVLVREVASGQQDRDEQTLGPPAKAAFGADGAPTKAAL